MILSRLKTSSALFILAVAAAAIGVPAVWTSDQFQGPSLKQSESGFRKTALFSVAPEYPQTLTSQAISGVVVAQVNVRPSGTVRSVEVLESPDLRLSEAMIAAVREWRFPAVKIPGYWRAGRVTSKVTYYFALENGKGVVRTPEQQAAHHQALVGVNWHTLSR